MVRGAMLALMLAIVVGIRASVLVPTYVLPPDSFVRDQRSLGQPIDSSAAESQRTIKRLIGGHMKIKPGKHADLSTNSILVDEKESKFAGVIVPDQSGSTVGWNQGIWDDGMLMSSAGEGKEAVKNKDDDEDKKTLSDQVAEGKYGLIQNEIFAKTPKRPGIVSYEPNSETRSKDNLQSLGGLKKEEIWLAEDHLLVLKGGSFPERTQETENKPWPPIDNYEAPRRQVKLPSKPKVPPPFPVRLSDDGPLVFLTPNGSVPAAVFPPFSQGEGEGSIYPAPFPFAPGPPNSAGNDQGNFTAGGTPMPIPPFPFLPGNASEGGLYFQPPMNGSFPEGFPPGAAFLPPPGNQTDLYDEDDPSIYYPPPYNFSYRAENKNNVPAGPLVPGIILPPPPDFFAPLEEKTTTEIAKTTSKPVSTYGRPKGIIHRPLPTPPPVYRKKTRPPTTTSTTETPREEIPITITTPPTVVEIGTTRKTRPIVVQIPQRPTIRVHNLPDDITSRPKTEKPVYKSRTKLTSKPISVSVLYDYPQPIYDEKPPSTSAKPYIVYSVPEKASIPNEPVVTSTPVPLRSYYSNIQNQEVPTTKLQPVYNQKPKENPVTSFYFYEEQPKTSPSPANFFDGRNYYKTVSPSPPSSQNVNSQNGFAPNVDVSYGAIDQADALFFWPQKHGTRTFTQEYFSIQKPIQQVYVQQPKQRPNFYQQITDIQQTIDLFTTKRPKAHSHRPFALKPKAISPSRPVYQFSYQSKQRPEQQLSFRAPKLDPEPFRPMVSYSKPLNYDNSYNAISSSLSSGYPQQYLIENIKVTTETPTSSKYYPRSKAKDDDYEDTPLKEVRTNTNINHIPLKSDKGTPLNYQINRHPSTTSNPITNGYYTKHDERYIDDITKNSFDNFGKKIEDVHSLAVTPPIGTVRTPIDNGINLQYAYDFVDHQNHRAPSLDRDTVINDRLPRPQVNPDSESILQGSPNADLVQPIKPPSLLDDTLVNDRYPRPEINSDSEFIPIPNPEFRSQQYRVQTQVQRPFNGEQYDLNKPSLADDTAVNYRRPLPPLNPDAEWVSPVNTAGEGRPGSFVSYRLPGEGAHVYFLTPQAAQATRDKYRSPAYGR